MTTCAASNESTSQHERWHIFARGQRIGKDKDCLLPPGNELITATIKALGGCDDAQNKCPLYCPSLISLFFGIFPSLRDEYLILAIAMEPTYKIITNFVEEIKTVQYV